METPLKATCSVVQGDMLSLLPMWAADGLLADAVICDPPYHLTSVVRRFGKEGSAPAKGNEAFIRASKGFMGQTWDGGDVALQTSTWKAVLDVMKPGAHLIAFGGTRTFHRMACAIEDAGFELRDTMMWLYGSGFPKSHDVSKGIDKAAGVDRNIVGPSARHVSGKPEQRTAGLSGSSTCSETIGMGMYLTAPATADAARWSGWGTALKPAWEPIILARKPLSEGTVAANVLRHGTGAINVDGCRIGLNGDYKCGANGRPSQTGLGDNYDAGQANQHSDVGRWPANVLHDGSEEVLAAFGAYGDKSSTRANGNPNDPIHGSNGSGSSYEWGEVGRKSVDHRDTGTAARFFYNAKASSADRVYRCTLCGESLSKSGFSAHAHDMKDFAHIATHPTCKPISLMRWLCRMVTPPGGLILDCFAGSGTTGQAAMEEGFNAILVEQSADYVQDIKFRISRAREKA